MVISDLSVDYHLFCTITIYFIVSSSSCRAISLMINYHLVCLCVNRFISSVSCFHFFFGVSDFHYYVALLLISVQLNDTVLLEN